MRLHVQFAVAELTHLRLGLAAPAQERAGSCKKLFDAEGFGNVVIRPEIEPQDDVRFLPLGGEHDDGHVQTSLTHQPADFVAIDPGKHDVKNDKVRFAVDRLAQAVFPVRRSAHVQTAVLEIVREHTKHRRIVFDDEDGFRGHVNHSMQRFLSLVNVAARSLTVNVLPLPS